MIYDKDYSPPRRTRSAISVPASRLRAGSTVRDVYLLHMRETDGGFVCAEGLSPMEMPFTDIPYKLYAADDDIICANHVVGENRDCLYAIFTGRDFYAFSLKSLPCRVVSANMKPTEVTNGTWNIVFPDMTLYCTSIDKQMTNYSLYLGGLDGVEYAGRFFLVQRDRIIYTMAFEVCNWEVDLNRDDPQRSGKLFVPTVCGDLVTAAVYRDDAYFFAQNGVLKLHMGGEIFETKTMFYPHGCGAVLKGSCQIVDDKIYFLTTKGLWRFDGNRFEHVPSPCLELADFSAEAETGAMNGQYYAHVALRDGNRRIVVYDPYYDRDRFLREEVVSFGAKYRGLVIRNDLIYEFTERGLPLDGDPCSLCCTFSLGGRLDPCTEWVRIEGEGEFTVEASTQEGGAAFAKGKAGDKLYLSRALRGAAVSLCISTFTEAFRITGVSIGIGEDEQYDD